MAGIHDIPREDWEEIRFALALNGGVSLAIWIGGVCMELSRLIRGSAELDPEEGQPPSKPSSVWGELLELVQSTVRVDVMAGASAGGINGALLGMAIAHGKPLDGLRDVWLQDASMTNLLRSPFEKDPPSLMKGDEYFLERLEKVFGDLVTKKPTSRERYPIDLTMTTTLLQGERLDFDDDFGNTINDIVHRGRFRFRRDRYVDHFETKRDARRLALAARSTASFPAAFEASFVPVLEGDDAEENGRPNMSDVASFTSSRYVMDGGVLVNKPIGLVLRPIFAMPADRQTRRVLAYVVPDPGTPPRTQPQKPTDPPSMAEVLRGVGSFPRVESIALDLEELRAHNVRVRNLQDVREYLLQDTDVLDLAKRLYPAYRSARLKATVIQILEELSVGTRKLDAKEAVLRREWTRDDLRRDIREAFKKDTAISAHFPEKEEVAGWSWDAGTLETIDGILMALLRRAINLTPAGPGHERQRLELRSYRKRLGPLRRRLAELRKEDLEFWQKRAVSLRDIYKKSDLPNAVSDAVESSLERRRMFRNLARNMASVLVSAQETLWQVVDDCDRYDEKTSQQLEAELKGLGLRRGTPISRAECRHRLLALAVVQQALAAGEPILDQPISLIQISAGTPNGFDTRERPDEKVAGVQLGHFGAFYKRSWRANDWMWGRLDGAWRLAQVVLSPSRIRTLVLGKRVKRGRRAKVACEAIEAVALGPKGAAIHDFLKGFWNADEAMRELAFLDEDTPELDDIPSRLEVCAGAVARRIQLEILSEELPYVADSIEQDRADQAKESPGALGFARAVNEAKENEGDRPVVPPGRAVELFRQCEIGRERIGGEVGSDLLTTTATTAMATAVSAAYGKRSGLGGLGTVLSSLRGFTLALFMLARSAGGKSRTAFAVLMTLLATGGAGLGLAVADQRDSGFVLWLGLALVAAGLTLAALRSVPWWVLGFILASVAAVIIPLELLSREQGPLEDVGPVLIVAVLVVASVLLGLVHAGVASLRNARRASLVTIALALGLVVGLSWGFGWPPVGVGASLLVLGVVFGWALLARQQIVQSLGKRVRAFRRWAGRPQTILRLSLISRAATLAARVALVALVYVFLVSLLPIWAVAPGSAAVGIAAGVYIAARMRSRELRLRIEPVRDDGGPSFVVSWSTGDVPEGVLFDVEVQGPGKETFTSWLLSERAGSSVFRPPKQDGGTYLFRVRRRKDAARWYWGWSRPVAVTVPSAREPEAAEVARASAPDDGGPTAEPAQPRQP